MNYSLLISILLVEKTDSLRSHGESVAIMKAVGNALVETCLDAISDTVGGRKCLTRKLLPTDERWAAPLPVRDLPKDSDVPKDEALSLSPTLCLLFLECSITEADDDFGAAIGPGLA